MGEKAAKEKADKAEKAKKAAEKADKAKERADKEKEKDAKAKEKADKAKEKADKVAAGKKHKENAAKAVEKKAKEHLQKNSATATLEVPAGFWAVTSHVAQQTVCPKNGIVWTPSASVSTDCAQRVASATMLSPANLVAAKKNKKKMLLKRTKLYHDIRTTVHVLTPDF